MNYVSNVRNFYTFQYVPICTIQSVSTLETFVPLQYVQICVSDRCTYKNSKNKMKSNVCHHGNFQQTNKSRIYQLNKI